MMGYALATAARDMGADVTLISGPTSLKTPSAMTFVPVETALEMRDAVEAACSQAHILIMNAAVADFRPESVHDQKIKKNGTDGLTLNLVRNPDILGELAYRHNLFKVGFAAETENMLENAQDKLERKELHMIVANHAVATMAQSMIQVTLIDRNGATTSLPQQSKQQTAIAILDAIVTRLSPYIST